jgi:diaminopimelate epimerase
VTDVLVKVDGAGNDFLLGTGHWGRRLAHDAGLVQALCDRRRGVGADGALGLERLTADRVHLEYRNADGGLAEFCANGTRCAARAAVELLGCRPELVVETGWVDVPATVTDRQVTLRLPPVGPPQEMEVALDDRRHTAYRVVVGVPHLVVPVDDPGVWVLERVAPPVRRDPRLGPGGANVHLMAVGGDRVTVRSYERGVEAETLCCGSGVVAAGLMCLAETGRDRVIVRPRSGDELEVSVAGPAFGGPVHLTGPTRMVARLDPLSDLEIV